MGILSPIKKLFADSKAIVLMYHRIAEPDVDPWELSVSARNFESHVEYLQRSARVIPVSELVENIQKKKIKKKTVCITFDDGYEDNYLYALPLLSKYKCPATFFITSGYIDSSDAFWWDYLVDIFLLSEKLPAEIDITINRRRFNSTLENDGVLTKEQRLIHQRWHWPMQPRTQRCKLYLQIWKELRDLPYPQIVEAVEKLKRWSGVRPHNDAGSFPMSTRQLLDLSNNAIAETGVHTVTHAALGAATEEIQMKEISVCKKYLDENLSKDHQTMAYPFGFYNDSSLVAAKTAGIKAAFTTDAKAVTKNSPLLQLGRYQVIDDDGDTFKQKIEKLLAN